MAILTGNKSTDQPKRPQGPEKKTDAPHISGEKFASNTIDTRYTDRSSLITKMQGSAWYVNYYQQLLGQNNEVSPLQLDKDPVYQQYLKIDNLELRVSDPLSSTQDPESNQFETSGSARTYPPLIPNKGDMFTAEVSDGQIGVFTVISSQRLTIYKDSAYEINYRLISYLTETYRNNLKAKTVQEFHFVKRLLERGQNPLVKDETYDSFQSAGEYYRKLLAYYSFRFFDKTTETMLVPGQKVPTFDPALVRMLQSTLDTDSHPIMRALRLYSTDIPGRPRPFTLWDVMLNGDAMELAICQNKMAILDAMSFGNFPQYDGVFFSNVDDVVYPINRDEGFSDLAMFYPQGSGFCREGTYQFRNVPIGNIISDHNMKGFDYEISTGTNPTPPGQRPLIHPVVFDDYYVFSQGFYTQDSSKQSLLENLVIRALHHQEFDDEDLFQLCENVMTWGALEQFYYIPILMMLLQLTGA